MLPTPTSYILWNALLLAACLPVVSTAQLVQQDFSQYTQHFESLEVPAVSDPVAQLNPVELHDYFDRGIETNLNTIGTLAELDSDLRAMDYSVESFRVDIETGSPNNSGRRASSRVSHCIITYAGTKCYTATGRMIVDAPPFPEDEGLFRDLRDLILNSAGSELSSRSSFDLDEPWRYATDTVHLADEVTGARAATLVREPLQLIEYVDDSTTVRTGYRYDRFLGRLLPALEERTIATRTESGLPATRRRITSYGPYFDPNVTVEDFDRLPAVVYPNPASDKLYLAAAAGADIVRAEVHNMIGERLPQALLYDNAVDVSGLPAGNYVVTYVAEDGSTYSTTFTKL